MKFDIEEDFVADYRRLAHEERNLFRQVIRQINEAYARSGDQPLPRWPASLRVKANERYTGRLGIDVVILRPRWSRHVTDALITVDGEVVLKWRRIGDHGIFSRP